MWASTLLLILCMSCGLSAGEKYTTDDPDYGTTWMYFPDGNNQPQVMYLSKEPKTQPQSRKLPDESILKKIQFHMYTRANRQHPRQFMVRRKRAQKHQVDEIDKLFNPDEPTKIYVHGWKSNSETESLQSIKDNYLKAYSCNVIAVDWRELADNSFYFTPAGQTREVGRRIAEMIDDLVRTKSANISTIHLIGHSLGAHAVGYAGSFTETGRVGRISGLDPAMPGFEVTAGEESRLDETDAEFVDVIHTSSGTAGFVAAIGHVDFYPNGGQSQPGCNPVPEIFGVACSHGRSIEYFAESIISKDGFIGYNCVDYGNCQLVNFKHNISEIMGDPTPNTARGIYFLQTNSKSPYAQGDRLQS